MPLTLSLSPRTRGEGYRAKAGYRICGGVIKGGTWQGQEQRIGKGGCNCELIEGPISDGFHHGRVRIMPLEWCLGYVPNDHGTR